uniref:Uncharacterized protein n=1 Tax=Trypanosoma vivax (strain Y486) TaxID=1055687 RepID=G0U4H3_TRYVY|nr:conserved hypothetical protein, fragment [Trypanosoma vivax Y486]
MRPRSSSSRNPRSPPGSQPNGTCQGGRVAAVEEPPLMPTLPPFVADPITLDAEDRHLKVYRDELFAREYERCITALHSRMVCFEEESRLAIADGDENDISCVGALSPAMPNVGNTQLSFLGVNGSSLPNLDDSANLASVPLTQKQDGNSADNLHSKLFCEPCEQFATTQRHMDVYSERPERSAAVLTAGSDPVAPATLPLESQRDSDAINACSIATTAGTLSFCHRGMQESRALNQPMVSLFAPVPEALLQMADEIGLENASRKTRLNAVTIALAQREREIPDVPPLKIPVALRTSTPVLNTSISASSPTAVAKSPPKAPPLGATPAKMQGVPSSPPAGHYSPTLTDGVFEEESRLAIADGDENDISCVGALSPAMPNVGNTQLSFLGVNGSSLPNLDDSANLASVPLTQKQDGNSADNLHSKLFCEPCEQFATTQRHMDVYSERPERSAAVLTAGSDPVAPATLPLESQRDSDAINACSIATTAGTLSFCHRGMQESRALNQPMVSLFAPVPEALLQMADEIGLENASRKTRLNAVTIALAQREREIPDVPPLKIPVALRTSTPVLNTSISASSPTAVAKSPPKAPPLGATPAKMQGVPSSPPAGNGKSPFFSLSDVFVLENQENVSVEIYCEALCKDIITLAAEMYVSRSFDAVASAYTALSTWDEMHDAVVRSFIPPPPPQPHKLETEIASALAIQSAARRSRHKGHEPYHEIMNVAKEASFAYDDGSTYLGMLPVWSATPSTLDADAILSFHANAAVRSSLYVSLAGRQRTTPVCNGTAMASDMTLGLPPCLTVPEASSPDPDVVNDESPGTPPKTIPIDTCARYVIPRSSSLEREGLQKRQKGEVMEKRTSQRRRRPSTIVSVSGDSQSTTRGKVDALSNRRASVQGLAAASSSRISVGSQPRPVDSPHLVSLACDRRGSKANTVAAKQEPSVFNGAKPGEEVVCQDEWTRALSRLPRGMLTAPLGGTASTNASPRQIHDNVVLIEGDDVTIPSCMKYGKPLKSRKDAASGKQGKNVGKGKGAEDAAPPEEKSVDELTAELRINICQGGKIAFQMLPPDAGMVAQEEKEEDQQKGKVVDNENRRRKVLFLSRRQQRALEERQRRKKEEEERAAYESLFFTTEEACDVSSELLPTVDSRGDEARAEEVIEPQVITKFVPEPGVVLERCPVATSSTRTKAANPNKVGLRRDVASLNVESRVDTNVLADGGEWIVPEGKHPWMGFDTTSLSRTLANNMLSPKQHDAGSSVNPHTNNTAHNQGSGSPPQKTPNSSGRQQSKATTQSLSARCFQRVPPTVIFASKSGTVESNEEQTEKKPNSTAVRVPPLSLKLRDLKKNERHTTLPRLPQIPSEVATPRRLTRPGLRLSAELSKVQALASALHTV